jgi:hypothetical protein
LEFLQEIVNTKLVDFSTDSAIVHCYGISQEPVSKDYVMVMEYMPEGDSREFLKSNY